MILGTPRFLTLEEVGEIHEQSILRYGGSPGLRDAGLLESAAAAPQASFGGTFLLDSIFEMAAAYLWHLAKNHAYVDGNKRVAAGAALVFLRLNGRRIDSFAPTLYDITIGAATGALDKKGVTVALENLFGRHQTT